jgi:hypothetical protein
MKLTKKHLTAALTFVALAAPLLASAQILPSAPPSGLASGFSGGGNDTIQEIIIRIIQIALALAGLIAILFLIIGGFRYITAGGNEDTTEAAKHTILNAIIGIVVIILAYVILRVIENALLGNV